MTKDEAKRKLRNKFYEFDQLFTELFESEESDNFELTKNEDEILTLVSNELGIMAKRLRGLGGFD